MQRFNHRPIGALFGQFLIVVIAFLVASSAAYAAKRVALVIGNSKYDNTSSLKNPVNDANLMAKSLEQAGFEVNKILDADYRTIKRAMLEFGRSLRNSPEAGLFYYAGHGVQVRGQNYLIPVNAQISDEDEVDLEAINVNSFLRVMNSSSSSINIVVLDACRNNPFARSFRSVASGLAPVDAPKGTYIAYATAPGDVAADGDGENSPYTVALAKAINERGITIEQVFKQARRSVLKITGAKQVPWETSSITGNFYFHKQEKFASLPADPINTPAQPFVQNILPTPNEAESVYRQIKDSENIEVLEIFASQFPDSIYSKFIQVRIRTLKQASLSKGNSNIRNTPKNSTLSDDELAVIMEKADKEYNAKNYKDAAPLYQTGVDNDDGRAMFFLGYLYEKGLGVGQDYAEAIRLYKGASSNGQSGAMYNLGVFYERGMGTTKNYKQAVRYYKMAADKDHVKATYNLGVFYERGQGVTRDYKEAARLYKLAAGKNHVSAQHNLGVFYDKGLGVSRDYKEAARLYALAAAKDHPDSIYGLGRLHNGGLGVAKLQRKSAGLIYRALKIKHKLSLSEMTTNYNPWGKEFRQEFQRKLRTEGYYNGAIDGEFGPATIQAIKNAAAG